MSALWTWGSALPADQPSRSFLPRPHLHLWVISSCGSSLPPGHHSLWIIPTSGSSPRWCRSSMSLVHSHVHSIHVSGSSLPRVIHVSGSSLSWVSLAPMNQTNPDSKTSLIRKQLWFTILDNHISSIVLESERINFCQLFFLFWIAPVYPPTKPKEWENWALEVTIFASHCRKCINLDNHISGRVLESQRELLNIEWMKRVLKD